jgi:citrate lyase subunit beta/citryl-CoA lyase
MRSILFVPGDSEKKFAKSMAATGDDRPDGLILDLEDSVAASEKPKARAMTAEFLTRGRAAADRPQLFVRINPVDTTMWQDDVAAVMGARPDGIFQPKCRSGADVQTLAAALDAAERKHGIAPGSTRIIAIITEVPVSLLNMASYVGCSDRISVMTWGAEDLSAAMGSLGNRDKSGAYTSPFRLARDLCLYAATAAGVQPMDTVYTNFRDDAGLAAECEASAFDGFTGKIAIHPAQVATINRVFTPSDAEIARSKRIIAAFEDNPGVGVVGMDGEMLDQPHLTRARRVLDRARAAGRTV